MRKHLLAASLALLVVGLCSCQQTQPATSESADVQRMQEYDRQMAKVSDQQVAADQQLKRAEEQQARMEALLQRWEKQADRYDAVLSRWEKQGKAPSER